ncbi:hypothetical protein ACFLXZ_01040 [Chloroflexota bacterium]
MNKEQELPEPLNKLQPIVAEYYPLLMDIKGTIEQEGEAAALQKVISTGANKPLRDYWRLFLANSSDFSAMSPEDLSETARKTTFMVVMAYAPILLATYGGEPPDLGGEVPSDFLKNLLKHPHPYQSFVSALYFTEYWRLSMEEIERRAETNPELMALLEYKEAQPWKEARRKALDHLKNMSFKMRAYEAERYGLDWLAQLERDIHESLLKQNEPWHEYSSEDDHFKYASKVRQVLYHIQRQFPKLEIDLITKIAEASLLSPADKEDIIKDIESECDLLVRCTVVQLSGYGEEHLDEQSALSKAFNDIEKVLKIQGIAWKYKDSLLGIGFSAKHKWREARITAQEGLHKGIKTWVSKDIQKIITEGLTGHLGYSLKRAVVNKLLDEIDRVHKVTIQDEYGEYEEQRKIPESILVVDGSDEDTDKSPLDLIAFRQGLTQTSFEDQLDNRDLLDRILQEAQLTKRQRLVIDLTRQGREDIEIVLALQKAFGKPTTEGNVRKLKHDAIQKLKLYAVQE